MNDEAIKRCFTIICNSNQDSPDFLIHLELLCQNTRCNLLLLRFVEAFYYINDIFPKNVIMGKWSAVGKIDNYYNLRRRELHRNVIRMIPTGLFNYKIAYIEQTKIFDQYINQVCMKFKKQLKNKPNV